jgi:ribosomal protein L11 methyltransferase
MSWIEIKLNIPHHNMEEISGYLFAQGCEGINLTENDVQIYFSDHRWTEEIQLGLIDYIQEIVPAFGPRDMKIVNVSDQDWNKNWKEFFKPIKVTNKVVIKPPWEDYNERTGEQVIVINPQMAFGTGHHESTQLVILALEKWIKEGMHVLDAGTGSGILAILAEKLGAESVLAFDNDPAAVKNAFENARLNSTTNRVKFYLAGPENLHPSEYDLVLANINRNVLIKYADIFPHFLKSGGKIIISGILRPDEAQILKVYKQAGFILVEKNAKKNWISLVLTLKNKIVENEESGY